MLNKKFDVSKKRKNEFYRSRDWLTMRQLAELKYEKICVNCGSRNLINLDHIRSIENYPNKCLLFGNVQFICTECMNKKINKKRLIKIKNKITGDFPLPYRLLKVISRRWTKYFPEIIKGPTNDHINSRTKVILVKRPYLDAGPLSGSDNTH
jgi:hypothetical protein